MQAFATLLDRLVYTRSRNAKLKLIADYLVATPDPDRGWALAALTGGLDLKAVQPKLVRTLLEERVDPVLLAMSYDYVGDMAETASLLWPEPPVPPAPPPCLDEVVERLQHLGRAEAPAALRSNCSTGSTVRDALRCSSWRPGRCGSGFRRGWRRPPLRKGSGSTSTPSRRCGTG